MEIVAACSHRPCAAPFKPLVAYEEEINGDTTTVPILCPYEIHRHERRPIVKDRDRIA